MEIKQILCRCYVNNMDQALEVYEKLMNESCTSRFHYREAGLEIARIKNLLIISGSDEALQPFRDTQATFLVDSIIEYRTFLLAHGATVIRDLRQVPTGTNMTVRHADGMMVEYVEHQLQPAMNS
ncbi:MAG: VOC family protein [Candidatus Delongbacteria bacterium]|nr:VOC family protein [Candidatus Delongbacteria bacterium]